MDRDQSGRKWIGTAIVYSLSSILSGFAAGILLGAVGSLLPREPRLASASLLAVLAILIGVFEFHGGRVASAG